MNRTLAVLAMLTCVAACTGDDNAGTPASPAVSQTIETSTTTSDVLATTAVSTIAPKPLPTDVGDRLTVSPSTATGGDTITITFHDARYNRTELLLYADGTSRYLIGNDSIQPTGAPTTVNGYDMMPSAEPLVLRLPTGIPAGDYVACIAQADTIADGPVCGRLVIAD